MTILGSTPSQTIGPFFHVAVPARGPVRLAPTGDDTVALTGLVLDGAGEPVDDALVEVWDARDGGFARCPTDARGSFSFLVTDRAADGYLAITVHARGLLRHLVTRCYLGGIADEADSALAAVPDDRRSTLMAERSHDGYRFDIRLQGDRETVFFAF